MLDMTLFIIISVVVLALAFDLINGFHDSANAIATSVLTRALSMRNAVLIAAAANFLGAMLSTGVAKTIANGIVTPTLIKGVSGQILVLAAVLAAIIWNLVTWWLGLPSSSSHALIGGLVGAGIAAGGRRVLILQTVNWHNLTHPDGILKIIEGLVLSPIFGFLAGAGLMLLIMNLFAQKAPSKINRHFRWMQVISAIGMAFAHGSNDAQKSMGIITLALVVGGRLASVEIPLWVKIACATMMAIGTAMGGWRIIKTVGKKVIGLQPVHGFAAETSAAIIIQFATWLSVPVSTTHVITSAITGVGSTKGRKAVRWNIVSQIVLAWVMTLPMCMILGVCCYKLLHNWLK